MADSQLEFDFGKSQRQPKRDKPTATPSEGWPPMGHWVYSFLAPPEDVYEEMLETIRLSKVKNGKR